MLDYVSLKLYSYSHYDGYCDPCQVDDACFCLASDLLYFALEIDCIYLGLIKIYLHFSYPTSASQDVVFIAFDLNIHR
jgi:hypothetical protein